MNSKILRTDILPIPLACTLLLLSACSSTSTGWNAAPDQSLALLFGARGADSKDDTGESDDAGGVIAIDYASRGEGSLGWEAGLSYSQHNEFLLFGGTSVDIDVFEASIGGRATYTGWAEGGWGLMPYASAGLSALAMSGRNADKGAAGAYVRAGLNLVFGGGLTTGIDLKWLASTSDYVESYGQFAFVLGWSF